MKSGIYSILNILNNKIYIGSSYDIYNRFYKHLNDLKANRHHCKHLQNAYNKYGNIFQLEIIEICSKEKLIEREQCWIDFFNPEYNSVPFAITGNAKGKITYQYDLDGNFIKEWKNANIAAEELNLCQLDIRRSSRSNRLRRVGNYIFRDNKENNLQKYSVSGKLIYCFNKKGEFIKTFTTTIEAAKFCNSDPSHISKICKGLYGFKSTKGYTFSYNN